MGSPWAYVNSSWDPRIIEYHLALRKSVPLTVTWEAHRDGEFDNYWRLNWILQHLPLIEDLCLGQFLSSKESARAELQKFMSRCISISPPSLKYLSISLIYDEWDESESPQLPMIFTLLNFPNLLHLQLQNCWTTGNLPSSLVSLDVHVWDTVEDLVVEEDIFQILWQCPRLRHCCLWLDNGPGSRPPISHLTALGSNERLRVPQMQYLTISLLALKWLHEKVHLESIPNLSISLPSESRLPTCFHDHASHATALTTWGHSIEYSRPKHFTHTFNNRIPISDIYSLFPSLQRLVVRELRDSDREGWYQALPSFKHLEYLDITGPEDQLADLLFELSMADPVFCPKLESLQLTTRYSSWIHSSVAADDKRRGHEDMKRRSIDMLETVLSSRAQRGIALKELIIHDGSRWAEDPDMWRRFVGVVTIRTEPEGEQVLTS